MSIEKVTDLLERQKLVEEMVRKQAAGKHELVDTLVHNQHSEELRALLAHDTATEVACVLGQLPLQDAQVVWNLVANERQDEVLWELGDELRQNLVGSRQPHFGDRHVVAFEIIDGKLRPSPIQERGEFTSIHPLWVDICKASQAERLFVGGHFGVDLADPSETTDLEVSARFRVEANDAIHLHSNFLHERQGEPHSVPVSFVLHKGVIFSVHNEELPIFRLLRLRAATQPGYVSDGIDILLDLYGADVEYSAGALEEIYQRLGMVGRQVLHETMTDKIAASILSAIADQEDRNGRIRSNILDTQRALSFLMRRKLLSPIQTEDTRQIMRDIESLGSHTSFLFDKINFLMDATVGFINVNQNRRVNQLTFLSVVFMPINVLAGIGGMSEFSMMTRSIPWPLAYGSFVVVMGLVGYGTYLIVKSLENRKLVKKATKAPGSKRLLAR